MDRDLAQVEWDGATTTEIRQFVRRSIEQFDVELVMIQKDNAVAEHFRLFLEESGSYLIYSTRHLWPEIPEARAEA